MICSSQKLQSCPCCRTFLFCCHLTHNYIFRYNDNLVKIMIEDRITQSLYNITESIIKSLKCLVILAKHFLYLVCCCSCYCIDLSKLLNSSSDVLWQIYEPVQNTQACYIYIKRGV